MALDVGIIGEVIDRLEGIEAVVLSSAWLTLVLVFYHGSCRTGSAGGFHPGELSEEVLRGQDLGRTGRFPIQRRGSYPRPVCRNDYPPRPVCGRNLPGVTICLYYKHTGKKG